MITRKLIYIISHGVLMSINSMSMEEKVYENKEERIPLISFHQSQNIVPEEQQRNYWREFAPLLVPASTGIGATISICVSFYDLYEKGVSIRWSMELTSHLFWLSSAVIGVAYNTGNLWCMKRL